MGMFKLKVILFLVCVFSKKRTTSSFSNKKNSTQPKGMRKKLLTMDQLLQEVHASLLPEAARRFRSKKLSHLDGGQQ